MTNEGSMSHDPERLWDDTPEHDGEFCECHECTASRETCVMAGCDRPIVDGDRYCKRHGTYEPTAAEYYGDDQS